MTELSRSLRRVSFLGIVVFLTIFLIGRSLGSAEIRDEPNFPAPPAGQAGNPPSPPQEAPSSLGEKPSEKPSEKPPASPTEGSPDPSADSLAKKNADAANEKLSVESPAEIEGETERFRIDSVLKIKQEEEIVEIRTSTIFSDGMVFDFIGDNGEIIIYHRRKGMFTLLDPIHRIQTELTSEDIDRFMTNIRTSLTEKKDRFCRFMLDPSFEISRNDESGEMLFQSKWIDYRIATRSFDEPAICDEYYSFSDAYSRLNIYLNPGTLTPLARMKVNETLWKEKRFPSKIKITVFPKGKWLFARIVEIESEHKIVRRLSADDGSRIIRAIHFSKQFPKMMFGKYYKTISPDAETR